MYKSINAFIKIKILYVIDCINLAGPTSPCLMQKPDHQGECYLVKGIMLGWAKSFNFFFL